MSEHDSDKDLAGLMISPPEPDAAARERALGKAMARFDSRQGIEGGARLRDHRGSSRKHAMTRARAAIAATAIVVVASPIAWKIAQDQRPSEPMVEASAPPAPSLAQRPAPAEAPLVAPAPIQATTPPPPAIQAEADARAKSIAPSDNVVRNQALSRIPAPAPAPPPPPAMVAPARPMAQAKGEVESGAAAPARARRTEGSRNSGSADFGANPVIAQERLYLPESVPAQTEETGRDQFANAPVSGFKPVAEAPVSTFSIDVDTASYASARAALARNVLPQPDAIRVEEWINAFSYDYAVPKSADEPFSVKATLMPSPWAEGRRILRIGVKGYALQPASRPAANLVFLIDTSGSMSGPNRLPLVKQSLALLLSSLEAKDRVAIVTYSGGAATLLEPTPASEKEKILAAIEGLKAGGGTAGGEGLRQAYAMAARNQDANAVNRVMLLTDGDFNIGIRNRDELKGFVERERSKGIFLSVLGFGMGNYNDALMQALAQNGNGTAAYIDTLNEARKVLVEEASATLFPIAKDVKIQVEFNPAQVSEYRLIGYETRALNREDFANDKVDAGEVGSGQSVTALYEIVPAGGPRTVSDLRYAPATRSFDMDPNVRYRLPASAAETAFVKLRYKLPKEDTSRLIETPVGSDSEVASLSAADTDARFATAVAGFAEILRGGRWTGRWTLDDVLALASAARGDDPYGARSEFLQMVRAAKTARTLQGRE